MKGKREKKSSGKERESKRSDPPQGKQQKMSFAENGKGES